MSQSQPDGYLALPPAGKGSGVLVLHPWWGLNATIKGVCNRLAEAGYVAFGADLYHGKVVDTIPDAETMAGTIFNDLERARADVRAAAAFLKDHPGQTGDHLAVVGFSLGAFFALDLSIQAPKIVRSVVVFYGTFSGDFSRAQADYLGHFAETDHFESQEDVDSTEAALKQAGRPVSFFTYPGTGHWFFEPDRADAYNEAAARLAWERTLDFLKRSPAESG